MKLSAIHDSLDRHMPDRKCSFEFGQCGVETLRVVKKALESGFNNFKVVEGTVYVGGEPFPHTWLEIAGEIRDPTASQFKGEIDYRPEGEHRDEYSPEEYLESFEDQYGISPSEI